MIHKGNFIMKQTTKVKHTLRKYRLLASQLLEHLCSTGKPITRLSHTDVEAELANTQLLHGILLLGLKIQSKLQDQTLPTHGSQ